MQPRKSANARKKSVRRERVIPRWAPYAAALTLTVLIMLTINFRGFTEYRREAAEHGELSGRIESLRDENLALQEEIHALKTDPKAVEAEARKYGLRPRDNKLTQSPAK